ncbi:hypothetical protein GCM10027570_37400 [Streptomonospora sediminis]
MRVDECRIVAAAGNDQTAIEGMSWHQQGCVRWTDARYGSVVGLVEEGGGTEIHVWAGIRNGLLVYECEDCIPREKTILVPWLLDEEEEASEPTDDLCRHAVAVALDAAERGARWYELPTHATPSRPELHKEADPKIKPGRGTLLSRLDMRENGLLLQNLLERRPELVGELERLAVAHLDEVDVAATAARVRRSLELFRPEELPAYFGSADGVVSAEYSPIPSDGFAYIEPDEVVLDYSLRPWAEDIARRCAVGAGRGGRDLALGVIKGLYNDRHESRWSHPLVAEYLEGDDVPLSNAQHIMALARDWGSEPRPVDLQKLCPEWAENLASPQY